MKTQYRSALLPTFEDTRPAPYFAAEAAAVARLGAGTMRATARPPLPRDGWLRELPPVDVLSASTWDDRHSPRWLRIAGLVAAVLLTLFALGLAASLLDAQRSRGADGREHLAAKA